MRHAELATDIRGFIIENFLFGESNINLKDDDSFFHRGLIDSTGVLELVAFVEEKYGISVADEELIPDNFDSINKLSAFIAKKMGDGN